MEVRGEAERRKREGRGERKRGKAMGRMNEDVGGSDGAAGDEGPGDLADVGEGELCIVGRAERGILLVRFGGASAAEEAEGPGPGEATRAWDFAAAGGLLLAAHPAR